MILGLDDIQSEEMDRLRLVYYAEIKLIDLKMQIKSNVGMQVLQKMQSNAK
jgi:hypothetical protein